MKFGPTLQRPSTFTLPLGFLAIFLLFNLVGCGPKFIPVEGLVTLDGQPVEGATITFFSEEAKGWPAIAVTDEDGVFHLSTVNETGIKPGNYKVIITKLKDISPPPLEDSKKDLTYATMVAPTQTTRVSVLPLKYGEPETTPLKCQIPPPSGLKVVLELKSDIP